MNRKIVAIVRYEKPLESVRRVIDFCAGLDGIQSKARIFIKPNIPFWTTASVFPKWGVITTSRVVEDTVRILKERGFDNITIGEGMVIEPNDRETPAHAFESLGYHVLKRRFGVRILNIHERTFRKVNLGSGVAVNFNTDILDSDFVINIPVLKTHAQTVVSLGIKNLKGMIDMKSRKKCHSAHPEKDLNYMIARLPNNLPPSLTLLDGIYTNERGPGYEGNIRRTDILVASRDLLSADKVGAKILGYEPSEVPHLVYAARVQDRPLNFSDLEIVGERIKDVASFHEYNFPYNEDGTLPRSMEKMGIKGLSYRQYDLTLCTYCVVINSVILRAIARAWKKRQGRPWDGVEVLTGKKMRPMPGNKKTILLGKCIYQANRDNPDIKEMIAIKGCPPEPRAVVRAFNQAGINLDPAIFERMDEVPGLFMKKYKGKAEFEESFFKSSLPN
ncbi:MAG: DUF362 domain-containing protein [Deltaproteobacteria bacterium]|nr:DUF362 domain-containing protein [Deltaproteobacteria bacterium]MBW2046196.1 DUF362 domain-containing protein [Deltaproteobacteria bacterium]MBW2299018.1 DUF362 domain-containing protein [Deltaproteobacteria bacterium]